MLFENVYAPFVGEYTMQMYMIYLKEILKVVDVERVVMGSHI